MKLFFTTIFVLLALSVSAQTIEVGYSPFSINAWGSLPETTKFDVGYVGEVYQKGVFIYKPGIRFTHLNSKSKAVDEEGDRVEGAFNMLFALPLSFDIDLAPFAFVNRFGAGFSERAFPNKNGLHLNFLLESGISYLLGRHIRLSIRYSHISNGFRGRTNPGVDNVVFSGAVQF